MIPFCCPSCAHTGQAPANAAGKKAKCPQCGQRLRLPGRRGETTTLYTPPVNQATALYNQTSSTSSAQNETGLPTAAWMPEQAHRPARGSFCLGLLALAVVLFLCGGGGVLLYWWGSQPAARERAHTNETIERAARELTEEQQIAWKKLRKEHADSPVRVLGYVIPDKRWRFASLNLHHNAWEELWGWSDSRLGFPYHSANQKTENEEYSYQSAEADAEGRAERTGVQATAVVDLFSEGTPRVLRWYKNDGDKTTGTETAPTAELEKSLRQFLLELMARAAAL